VPFVVIVCFFFSFRALENFLPHVLARASTGPELIISRAAINEADLWMIVCL
jgi:hypothetical protein